VYQSRVRQPRRRGSPPCFSSALLPGLSTCCCDSLAVLSLDVFFFFSHSLCLPSRDFFVVPPRPVSPLPASSPSSRPLPCGAITSEVRLWFPSHYPPLCGRTVPPCTRCTTTLSLSVTKRQRTPLYKDPPLSSSHILVSHAVQRYTQCTPSLRCTALHNYVTARNILLLNAIRPYTMFHPLTDCVPVRYPAHKATGSNTLSSIVHPAALTTLLLLSCPSIRACTAQSASQLHTASPHIPLSLHAPGSHQYGITTSLSLTSPANTLLRRFDSLGSVATPMSTMASAQHRSPLHPPSRPVDLHLLASRHRSAHSTRLPAGKLARRARSRPLPDDHRLSINTILQNRACPPTPRALSSAYPLPVQSNTPAATRASIPDPETSVLVSASISRTHCSCARPVVSSVHSALR
jgi:hypothetical protein